MIKTIYDKSKKQNPALTENNFIEHILNEWLTPYYKNYNKPDSLHKNKIVLKNNLKHAMKLSGKTQAELAEEVGITRTYLSHIINGKYDVSTKLALAIVMALDYPLEKYTDIFFLEAADEE